ncbi:MAG: hypothetical protein PF961_06120 [Planctomycetota bacterium]|jgi:hypothetical protein|nr:hypothetical protein [Planctomycetota bacterium]
MLEAVDLDRRVARDVLGWRLSEADSAMGAAAWCDRGGDLTGFVDAIPAWWQAVPELWRVWCEPGPRVWTPCQDVACRDFLEHRLRLNGYFVSFLSDDMGSAQPVHLRHANGSLIEVWERGLNYGESLCVAALRAFGLKE